MYIYIYIYIYIYMYAVIMLSWWPLLIVKIDLIGQSIIVHTLYMHHILF